MNKTEVCDFFFDCFMTFGQRYYSAYSVSTAAAAYHPITRTSLAEALLNGFAKPYIRHLSP